MDKETKQEFDNLALLIAEGFKGMDKRFSKIEGDSLQFRKESKRRDADLAGDEPSLNIDWS